MAFVQMNFLPLEGAHSRVLVATVYARLAEELGLALRGFDIDFVLPEEPHEGSFNGAIYA